MTEINETAENVTRIIASRKAEAVAKIEKANNRLAKAGVAERFAISFSTKIEVESFENGFKVVDEYYDVTLNAPAIGYNGWKFVATLAFEEAGTVVRTVPGEACAYRPSTKECDQCHTSRERNETFVVQNVETGEYKQVGRNCLALFFGIKPNLWVLGFGLDEFSKPKNEGGNGPVYRKLAVESIVAAALAVSDEGRSYKPASFYGETTKGQAQDVVYGFSGRDENYKRQVREWAEQAQAHIASGLVAKVIEHAASLSGSGEYAENARVLARSTYVDSKNFGIVASFAKLWANEQQRNAEVKAKAAVKANVVDDFYAPVGEKVAVEGTVTNVRYIDGDYGTTTLVEWLSTEGYMFKWFASGHKSFTEGETVKLTGTVKKHDEFQGRKATTLTRCKMA